MEKVIVYALGSNIRVDLDQAELWKKREAMAKMQGYLNSLNILGTSTAGSKALNQELDADIAELHAVIRKNIEIVR